MILPSTNFKKKNPFFRIAFNVRKDSQLASDSYVSFCLAQTAFSGSNSAAFSPLCTFLARRSTKSPTQWTSAAGSSCAAWKIRSAAWCKWQRAPTLTTRSLSPTSPHPVGSYFLFLFGFFSFLVSALFFSVVCSFPFPFCCLFSSFSFLLLLLSVLFFSFRLLLSVLFFFFLFFPLIFLLPLASGGVQGAPGALHRGHEQDLHAPHDRCAGGGALGRERLAQVVPRRRLRAVADRSSRKRFIEHRFFLKPRFVGCLLRFSKQNDRAACKPTLAEQVLS